MAISLHTAGSWVAANATTQTVTLPTHSTGDMLLVRVGFKHATMPTTVTCGTAGWAKLGEKNSGTGSSSNGGGDVQVAVFWKVAASAAETNPVITFNAGSVAATPSAAVANSYSKGAGESWNDPVGDGAAISVATNFSATIASHVSATAGDLIEVLIVTNDNTTLTVPTFTQASLTLAAVVESPAAALSSTTSNDIAADGAYRIATSGTSSAAAVVTGTNSVADIGEAWTTRLRVFTPDPKTSLPTQLDMTLTGATPTVAVTLNILSVPTTLELTLTGATPTVAVTNHIVSLPSTLELTLTGAVPAVATPVVSEPTVLALTLTGAVPDVAAPALSLPTALALAWTGAVPSIETPVASLPTELTMTLTGSVPDVTVTTGSNVTVLPDVLALVLSLATPSVVRTDNIVVTPDIAAFNLSFATPAVGVTDSIVALPTALALAWTGAVPVVVVDGPQSALPGPLAFAIAFGTPVVAISSPSAFRGGRRIRPELPWNAARVIGPAVSLQRRVDQRAIQAARKRRLEEEWLLGLITYEQYMEAL